MPVNAAEENFEINHADNLEILEDKIVLSGGVSVSSKGGEKFTLNTSKLISLKNKTGEFSDIETFGPSTINSERFLLKANKIFFRKDSKTKKYNLLDASNGVEIISKDGSQKITAPNVKIALDNKMLYATGGVISEQMVDENGKKQRVTISSAEQDIDLNETPDKKKLQKQLTARKKVLTKLQDGQVDSELAELYALNGKGEKAVFTGNAKLATEDKTKATGKIITYFLNQKLLVIEEDGVLTRADGTEILGDVIKYNSETKALTVESGKKAKVANLRGEDGTKISGGTINYNSETKALEVAPVPKTGRATLIKEDGTDIQGSSISYSSENKSLQVESSSPTERAVLRVPYKEKSGAVSYITIKADSIINEETAPGESLLTARQFGDEGLVELDYGTRKGWGRQLFINQNEKIPDKKGDNLVLVDNAKLVDLEKNQVLEGPVIQVGLGEKTLYSGFTGRAKGSIPLQQAKADQKEKSSNTASSKLKKKAASQTKK